MARVEGSRAVVFHAGHAEDQIWESTYACMPQQVFRRGRGAAGKVSPRDSDNDGVNGTKKRFRTLGEHTKMSRLDCRGLD